MSVSGWKQLTIIFNDPQVVIPFVISITVRIQSTISFLQVVYLHACEQPTDEPISICDLEVHMHNMDIQYAVFLW
jgi:hypothetical protein